MANIGFYRKDIDGLRAIAVLSVIIFHAYPNFLPGGFVGVDIFFVISGYLITSILVGESEAGTFSLFQFYVRRIKRIFPALIVVLIFVYVYGWFNFLSDDYAVIGKHIAAGASFTSNFISWAEAGYFDSEAIKKPLLHLWSLAIEEQFYIFWPFFILLICRLKLSFLKVVTICLGGSFVWGLIQIQSDSIAAFYSPLTRFWELLIGAILVGLKRDEPIKAFINGCRGYLSYFGIALISISFVSIDHNSLFPGVWAILPTLGAALIILDSSSLSLPNRLLGTRFMVWVGLISYPLYLWHWPLLSIGNWYWADGFSDIRKFQVLLLTVLLATATYFFIERPIRFGEKFKKTKIITLCFLISFVGVMGYSCYIRDGIPMRHRDFMKQISTYQYDKVKEQQQNICFLMGKNDNPLNYVTQCSNFKKGLKIILWGDSHAGSLYPGLKQLEKDYPISVVQYSLAGCGGLLPDASDKSYCVRANKIALDQVKKIRPDYVLLHKHWSSESIPKVGKLIDELRQSNLKVILVGPTPTWSDDAPKLVYKYWKINKKLPPEYFSESLLLKERREIDSYLANLARLKKIDYYSLLDEFCNHDGCRIVMPGKEVALIATDAHHITPAAASFGIKNLGLRYFR
jgi:peptidoglycan/LPS O-acetylase OafA/YrhL